MTEELDHVRNRVLNDTGAFARQVCGYDFDLDEDTGEEKRPGGIRADGPHKVMTDFIDGPEKEKLLLAPRGSYKTSALIAKVCKTLVKDPNRRFGWGMATHDRALKISGMVRWHFETNERLRAWFGDCTTEDWGKQRFNVKGRTQPHVDPSFTAFSIDKNVTGFHCTDLILDDLVIAQNCKTEAGLQRTIDAFRMAQPFLDAGGQLIVSNTMYNDADLTSFIRNNLSKQFKILVLDSGVDIQVNEEGRHVLVGKPLFAHQPMSFLERKFGSMSAKDFSTQYLNRSLPSGFAEFNRTDFRSCRWNDAFKSLSFYILTDTATTSREEGCMSVAALIGLDSTNRCFLFDLAAGHFVPYDYVTTLLGMFERWMSRIAIRCITFEKVALASTYKSMLEEEGRRRGLRLNLVEVPRGSGDPSKEQRIRSLNHRFRIGGFVVCDTVPKFYNDLGTQKLLWDPEGYRDEKTGLCLPDGELVLQFIRFPVYPKTRRDIADALADMDAHDAKGNRFCIPSRESMDEYTRKQKQTKGRVLQLGLPGARAPQKDVLVRNDFFSRHKLA